MPEEDIKLIQLSFVNAFLVKTKEGFVLIDTGLISQWEKLERALMAAGCVPGNLKLVVLTHGDADHAGNGKRFQEKYHVKIAMHKDDYSIIETGFSGKRKIKHLAMRIMFWVVSILRKLRKNQINRSRFKPDILLRDGQGLQEYGLNAHVVHIPGHTKGSIAILTDQGDLFAGDTLVNMRKPVTATIIENEAELKESIEKLLKLNIQTVYPGHGRPFLMESLKQGVGLPSKAV
jgi:glyoxylase-like metal-dependent hydrolase (beta-lactamase superfamily II)